MGRQDVSKSANRMGEEAGRSPSREPRLRVSVPFSAGLHSAGALKTGLVPSSCGPSLSASLRMQDLPDLFVPPTPSQLGSGGPGGFPPGEPGPWIDDTSPRPDDESLTPEDRPVAAEDSPPPAGDESLTLVERPGGGEALSPERDSRVDRRASTASGSMASRSTRRSSAGHCKG